MGEVEARIGRGTRRDLQHERRTVSLLIDHLVFSPKYRGKVLLGEVAEAAEEIVIDEEKEKTLKIGYITLYTKFFHAHMLRYLSTGYVTDVEYKA
jgi:REP element-mobilizing transposase RayT